MNQNTSDKHAAVTAEIIRQLENGTAPWVRPWSTSGVSDMPTNAHSKRPYHGANVIQLWMNQTAFGYPTAEWVSFKQALEFGGSVRKGEHGVPIFFVSSIEREEKNRQGEDVTRRIPFLKAYTVFNVAQCDGLPARELASVRSEFERLENVETYLRAVGAKVGHGGDRAFYSPSSDSIQLPNAEQFNAPADYYGTALHEHGHWTGAEHRLARTFGKRFGDDAYAFEELVAELTAAFLCAELEIPGHLQHPEYIANWIKVLKGDAKAIWTAGARATEAAAYLNRAAGVAGTEAPAELTAAA